MLEVASGAPEDRPSTRRFVACSATAAATLELPRIVNAADARLATLTASRAVEISEQALLGVRLDQAARAGQEEALDRLARTQRTRLPAAAHEREPGRFIYKSSCFSWHHTSTTRTRPAASASSRAPRLAPLRTPHENVPSSELLTKLQMSSKRSGDTVREMLEDICEHKELEDAKKQFARRMGTTRTTWNCPRA